MAHQPHKVHILKTRLSTSMIRCFKRFGIKPEDSGVHGKLQNILLLTTVHTTVDDVTINFKVAAYVTYKIHITI